MRLTRAGNYVKELLFLPYLLPLARNDSITLLTLEPGGDKGFFFFLKVPDPSGQGKEERR